MDSADLDVLRNAVRWREEGSRVTLITVVQTWGSSPRPVGSLLAVRADGRHAGSVSGGCVEDDLIERLRGGEVATRLPEVVRYGGSRSETQRFGLPCGGTLELVVEPVWDAGSLRAVLAAIERRGLIARRLEITSGAVSLCPAQPLDDSVAYDGRFLSRVFGPRWRLLIIGAGQLSRYLAQMALALDYHVIVCDPRADYADAWDVPGIELERGMPDDVVKARCTDARCAVVAVTHDPKLDDLALLEALTADAFYVGALGSKANNARRRERLAALGVPPTAVARLHGPVGLPIGSRTPPEIAIAILAEMTAVRHGARAAALATAQTGAAPAADPLRAAAS